MDDEKDLDIAQLTAALTTVGSLEAKYKESLALMATLRRTLVMRLLRKQHPRMSIHEQTKLLKAYGVES